MIIKNIKIFLKFIIPDLILRYRIKLNYKKIGFEKKSLKEIFSDVYKLNLWDHYGISKNEFYSGIGSRNKEINEKYFNSLKSFFTSLEKKPIIVDLGCGDFFIGSQLTRFANNYIAVDIVDELINFNKKKYNNLGVDFQSLDITKDNLPKGDVVIIREVFQHLSNKNIQNVLDKIKTQYKYLIFTETLPNSKNFKANKDFLNGPDTRRSLLSGIILTKSPFNLIIKKHRTLLEIYQKKENYILRTELYEI